MMKILQRLHRTAPVKSSNTAVNTHAIIPTLVICLGRFGHEVGLQIAERLQLMESGLHQEGLVGPLLVRVDAQSKAVSDGFVRIMELDWIEWLTWVTRGLPAQAFLKDIDITVGGQKHTMPCKLDEDWHKDDVQEARDALRNELEAQLLNASRPLRQRSMYKPTNVAAHKFKMRLVLVGAAREAGTAELAIDLIEQLGAIYIKKRELAHGIQLFCYIGGTSLEEHVAACNDAREFIKGTLSEVERKRMNSMLRRLDHLCSSSSYPLFEQCYLLDSQLANRMEALRGPDYGSDEVVLASALAVSTLIATNCDGAIRPHTRRWRIMRDEPGIFGSVGIASYCVDHPRLHRLVYSWTIGEFLMKARPIIKGDRRPPSQSGHGAIVNYHLEAYVRDNVAQVLDNYNKHCSAEALQANVAPLVPPVSTATTTQIVSRIQRCPAKRRDIEQLLAVLSADMEATVLEHRLQVQKDAYKQLLQDEIASIQQQLYQDNQAPLIQVYRFMAEVSKQLQQQLRGRTSNNPSLFSRQLHTLFNQTEFSCTQDIQKVLTLRPTRRSTFGHVLLITATLATIVQLLPPTTIDPAQPLLLKLFVAGLWSAGALILWWLMSNSQSSRRKKSITHAVETLRETWQTTLTAVDTEAWQAAQAEYHAHFMPIMHRLEDLCKAGGFIAFVRDELLKQDFAVQNRVLERMFLTDELKMQLRKFIEKARVSEQLWNQRGQLLQELVEKQPLDPTQVEAWLYKEVEQLYRGNQNAISNLVISFFENQPLQEVDTMYTTLANEAVLFLQHNAYTQDDPTTHMMFFTIHDGKEQEALSQLTNKTTVTLLHSIEKLRWTFLHVQVGLHLDDIRLSAIELNASTP